jgi:hypothetical protein
MPNETKAEKFTAAFIELVKEDREIALQLVTGMFVTCATRYIDARGCDSDKTINIEANDYRRAITIHAADDKETTDAE